LMLIEMPHDELVPPAVCAWLTKLLAHHPDNFKAAMNSSAFRLQRLPGAPDVLPLLSAKEQLRVQKLYAENKSIAHFMEHVEGILD
jgi:hypothetical protein